MPTLALISEIHTHLQKISYGCSGEVAANYIKLYFINGVWFT